MLTRWRRSPTVMSWLSRTRTPPPLMAQPMCACTCSNIFPPSHNVEKCGRRPACTEIRASVRDVARQLAPAVTRRQRSASVLSSPFLRTGMHSWWHDTFRKRISLWNVRNMLSKGFKNPITGNHLKYNQSLGKSTDLETVLRSRRTGAGARVHSQHQDPLSALAGTTVHKRVIETKDLTPLVTGWS